MMRYFTFRLYPTPRQKAALLAALEVCRTFHNKLLQDRIAARRAGQKVGQTAQYRQVAVFRRDNPAAAKVHSHPLQVVASNVDRAWRDWHKKRKRYRFYDRKGQLRTPGEGSREGDGPRLREEGQIRSITFKGKNNGYKIIGRKVRVFKVGLLAVRWHRPIEGEVKTLSVCRRFSKWYAIFGCIVRPEPLPLTGSEIGVDLGTDSLLVLSNGERVENPRFAKAAEEKLAALWARVNRAVPGSAGQKKALLRVMKQQVRIAARRRDYLSKVANDLVARFDRIAIEDLDIAKLASILRQAGIDAGWAPFRKLLQQKAEAAGRVLTFVSPDWTSKTCSACGGRNRRRLPLTERQFCCERCHQTLDRDLNAARVVLQRAQAVWRLSGQQAGPQPLVVKTTRPESRPA